jgi:glycosyltransferase involved in cell wall biosynthesis
MANNIVLFGSSRPVTCAVMDYARRLKDAINQRLPGLVSIRTIEPAQPRAFVGAIVDVLKGDGIAHFQLPIEGWGNALLPGSALMAARALTRRGKIVTTLHEWTSLNQLRYLSMIPDVLATDQFIFVSAHQRETFLRTPLVSRARKIAAPVIPIGPNIMPQAIDEGLTARERARIIGEGTLKADLIVGFFGVLYASKRPDLLLRSVAALHAKGIKARLLVCGDFLWDKPHDRAAFMAVADELGLQEWLDFRGRIEDEGALMATLAASDVFLLPYSDGISARRGSFQAIAKLAIPLVSTLPERADEFSSSKLLTAKIDNEATVLCPANGSADDFADAILVAHGKREQAISVDLATLWDEAAEAHLRIYERLLRNVAAPHMRALSLPAE